MPSLSFFLSFSPTPPSPSFSVFLSLCVDNVSANDLTALVEAPSSNWTSRDWALYRKTIVILSQISTTAEIRQYTTMDWTLRTTLLLWTEGKNQVGFFSSKRKKNHNNRMGWRYFSRLEKYWKCCGVVECTSCKIHVGVKCSLGWYLFDLRGVLAEKLGNN